MHIDINDHRKIYSIQHDFNALFPNLKIEFHSKAHTQGGASSEKIVAESSKTLGQCRVDHNKGNITISPNMTAIELKQNFGDIYGLHVNILKKSGAKWIELENQNKLSLAEQNK